MRIPFNNAVKKIDHDFEKFALEVHLNFTFEFLCIKDVTSFLTNLLSDLSQLNCYKGSFKLLIRVIQ